MAICRMVNGDNTFDELRLMIKNIKIFFPVPSAAKKYQK
jgi:hypothetical protein